MESCVCQFGSGVLLAVATRAASYYPQLVTFVDFERPYMDTEPTCAAGPELAKLVLRGVRSI